MTHSITLPAEKYQQIEKGERFIFTKRLPVYSEGDLFNINLEGQRSQLSFKIARIDTAKVFKNYCIVVLEEYVLVQIAIPDKESISSIKNISQQDQSQ